MGFNFRSCQGFNGNKITLCQKCLLIVTIASQTIVSSHLYVIGAKIISRLPYHTAYRSIETIQNLQWIFSSYVKFSEIMFALKRALKRVKHNFLMLSKRQLRNSELFSTPLQTDSNTKEVTKEKAIGIAFYIWHESWDSTNKPLMFYC